jgi:CHC2 zinc finger
MNPDRTRAKAALRVDKVILRFRKDKLPPAATFYEAELGRLTRPNRKGWYQANCPFHKSKSGKSFAVNSETGAFHCWGCDARGGDIVDFVMLRNSLSFKEACQQLGCWDEAGQPVEGRPGPPVRYLVLDFRIGGVEYRAEVKDEPKSELQLDRRFYANAKDRLTEIRKGDAEVFEGEEQAQWGILASSWELIRMGVGDGN